MKSIGFRYIKTAYSEISTGKHGDRLSMSLELD